MTRRLTLVLCVVAVLGVVPGTALAQKSVAEVFGRSAAPDGQPKSYLEEITLYFYIENSYVGNLGKTGRGDVNEIRFYDHDNGYTFNAAELSVKKDPSERYRLGWGVVVTAGIDSQKNHSLGIFRDIDDSAPLYRNTAKFDLPEAYVAYLVPVGEGLTLKAGKWATPVGYEGYESPKNLNFSRSFLYTLGTPYTHTGVIASYPFAKWLTVGAGITMGWDNSDNNNGHVRPIVTADFTPIDKLTAGVHAMWGPEQNRNQMRDGDVNNRWIVDSSIQYTGIDRWTFAVNFDVAGEQNDPALVATRGGDTDSQWWGVAGYAAYDWTKTLRTIVRAEYFADPDGVRASETVPPGANTRLWEITATAEYKIWKGLVGRLEYRHDQATRKAFSVRNERGAGLAPTSEAQNTITLALYYSFF